MDLRGETNAVREDDAMGANNAIVGTACRNEAVSIDMILVMIDVCEV